MKKFGNQPGGQVRFFALAGRLQPKEPLPEGLYLLQQAGASKIPLQRNDGEVHEFHSECLAGWSIRPGLMTILVLMEFTTYIIFIIN